MKNSSSPKTTWTWNWIGGGYNSCQASSFAEALLIATSSGIPRFGGITLVPNPDTLRPADPEELRSVERSLASTFD